MKKLAIAVTAGAIALTGVALTAPAAGAATTPRVKSYTAAQVAQHASTSDCWTIIGRSVYNLSPYVNRHPGGPAQIAAVCGRNGTAAFQGQHGGNSGIANMLKAYRLGKLKK